MENSSHDAKAKKLKTEKLEEEAAQLTTIPNVHAEPGNFITQDAGHQEGENRLTLKPKRTRKKKQSDKGCHKFNEGYECKRGSNCRFVHDEEKRAQSIKEYEEGPWPPEDDDGEDGTFIFQKGKGQGCGFFNRGLDCKKGDRCLFVHDEVKRALAIKNDEAIAWEGLQYDKEVFDENWEPDYAIFVSGFGDWYEEGHPQVCLSHISVPLPLGFFHD